MSKILRRYTICCNAPQTAYSTGLRRSGLFGGQFSGSMRAGKQQCGVNDVPALRPAEADWGALQQMVYRRKISNIDQLKHLD